MDLIDQKIRVYKNDKIIKNIKCSTGVIGKQDTETPLGIFILQIRENIFIVTNIIKVVDIILNFCKLFNSFYTCRQNGNIIEEEKTN
ncbi:L,D-transpeptidase [Clostridium botulinum]|nr:L,D-transpeptidase [Clostridium botulinum]MCS4521493.1 L,D-transpeptidase [Clostridium botulinum]